MKKLVVGIDIGGTTTAFALVDENGEIHGSSSLPTNNYLKFSDYIIAIKDGILDLSKKLDFLHTLCHIGIGAPNASFYTGCIKDASNLIWKGVLPLTKDLSIAMGGIPTVTTNDANAAAMGEMIYGSAKGMKDFVVITLGTGLGSGFITNGNILYGHDGFAGEFGHICIEKGGRECGCGRKGCLETYVSATGIVRTAVSLMAELNSSSGLRNIAPSQLTSKDIATEATKGDPIAIESFKRTGKVLGEALADLVAITTPEAIFLFGGAANAGDLIMKPTKKAFENSLLNMWKSKVRLEFSSVDNSSAAILGAAALAWNELNKITSK